jgi:hypothetical protein
MGTKNKMDEIKRRMPIIKRAFRALARKRIQFRETKN